MTKAEKNRLLKSKFFHELEELVKAWDFYLCVNSKEQANEMFNKWEIAKLALEHITGNLYGLSRDGYGTYSIVNERDYNERIITGKNFNGGLIR
jgi:hypothetical protein